MKEILKEKNIFKFNKLILYVYSNSLYLFIFLYKDLKILKYKKILKFLIIYIYIFYILHCKIKYKKIIFFIIFFSFLLFGSIGNLKSISIENKKD